MSYTYYRPSGFKQAIIQTVGAEATGSTATDTFTAAAAHGLAVGDCIAFTAIGGASGIALLTRYFVINVADSTHFKISATRGGVALTIGTGTAVKFKALTETRLYLANKAAANAETSSITWEGDDRKIKKDALEGITVVLDLDAVPASAHATIFGHTTVGVTLPGGITNAFGIGGGNDTGGVSCGIRLETSAIKNISGVETNVSFYRWFPVGVLTLLKTGDIQTSNKPSVTQYSFAATAATTDLLGVAIPNASALGDYFFEGDA